MKILIVILIFFVLLSESGSVPSPPPTGTYSPTISPTNEAAVSSTSHVKEHTNYGNTYFGIVVTSQIIGSMSSALLLWLINDSKFDNVYSICVFLMTVGLLIFSLSGILMFCLAYAKKITFDNPGIAWLTIIRMTTSLFAYYVSSYLSYSVYHIIVNQCQVNVKDEKNRIIIAGVIISLLIPYIGIAISEFYDYKDPAANSIRRFDISLYYNFVVRLVFIIYNFINYFICEYYVRKLYGKGSNSNKAIIIKTLVNRLRLYPLFQFISFIGEFARCEYYGFINANVTSSLRSTDLNEIVFSSFAEVFLYLDGFFMLAVYVCMTPDAHTKLKSLFFKIDEFGNDIERETIPNASRPNSSKNQVVQLKRGSGKLSSQEDLSGISTFRHDESMYSQADVDNMTDNHLTHLIVGNVDAGRATADSKHTSTNRVSDNL